MIQPSFPIPIISVQSLNLFNCWEFKLDIKNERIVDIWKFSVYPTRQSQHGRVILAVRHPRGVWDAVPPQVGVVVGGGQHNASHLGECPVLCGKSGAHQDPATQAGHKAAYLQIHHHRPVLHGERCSSSKNNQDLLKWRITSKFEQLLTVGNWSALSLCVIADVWLLSHLIFQMVLHSKHP